MHELTKAEARAKLKADWGYDPGARAANLLHRNAIAAALGAGIAVSPRILSEYGGTDWTNHPLYRNGSNPLPMKPATKASEKQTTKANFYETGVAILASGMTGIGTRRQP